jgi:YHS domain-containing protein
MKKTLFVTLFCILALSAVGFAKTDAKVKPENKTVICPVTNTKITPATAYDKTVYKGKTYYFCCSGCKPEFLKNPDKYIKAQNKPAVKHDMKNMKNMKM